MARVFMRSRPNESLSQYLVGDHIFGLIPLMASLLNGAGGITEGGEDLRLHVNTETAVCPSPSFDLLVQFANF